MTVNTLALAVLAIAASAYGATVFEGAGLDNACLEKCPCHDQAPINAAAAAAATSGDYTEVLALGAESTKCSTPCTLACSKAATAVCLEQKEINGWEFMDADQMACGQGAGLHCTALVTTFMTGTVGVGNCVPAVAPENDDGSGGGGGGGASGAAVFASSIISVIATVVALF